MASASTRSSSTTNTRTVLSRHPPTSRELQDFRAHPVEPAPSTLPAMKTTSLVLLAVLCLAGCSSGGGQAPATLAKTDEIGRAAVQSAQCMRDHGYSAAD